MRARARPRVRTCWAEGFDVDRLHCAAAIQVVAVNGMNRNLGGGEQKTDDEEH